MNDLKTVTETYSKYINSIPKAREFFNRPLTCLLYTSDAADE